MNKKTLSVLAAVVLMAVFAISPAVLSQSPQAAGSNVNVGATFAPHPLITRAINALQFARTELQDAAHQYCGHREEALGAVDAALHQLHLAIECQDSRGASAGDVSLDLPEVTEVSAGGGAPHPRISAAIAACQAARNNLANAAQVYCGHRAEALGAVDHALEQLHRAVECQNW